MGALKMLYHISVCDHSFKTRSRIDLQFPERLEHYFRVAEEDSFGITGVHHLWSVHRAVTTCFSQ
jgi:hypothetical protein